MACHILPQLLKCIEYFVCLITMILRLSPLPHHIIHRTGRIFEVSTDVHGCSEDIVRLSSTNCCERAKAG